MQKTRKPEWLVVQGYPPSSLPHIVTWYAIDKNDGRERELRGRTDDYTLNLYRAKGFVLDRKYLDPQLWHELEYGVTHPALIIEAPEPSGMTPRLAKAIRGAMIGRDFWQGTPSELLAVIGVSNWGMPKSPISLSIEGMKPRVFDAWNSFGIAGEKRRSNGKRLLCLKDITL